MTEDSENVCITIGHAQGYSLKTILEHASSIESINDKDKLDFFIKKLDEIGFGIT